MTPTNRLLLFCVAATFAVVPIHATELLSGNLAGTDTGNDSTEINENFSPPVFGAFILMDGEATDLTPIPDGNGTDDVFLRNIETGVTQLVSVDQSGTAAGNGKSWSPQMSADGRFVLFTSEADNLVPNDTNGGWDTFVRDLEYGRTYLLSRNPDGDSGAGNSYAGLLSADANWIFFDSRAADIAPVDSNMASDVFRSPVPLFADGFESGDFTWWSAVEP